MNSKWRVDLYDLGESKVEFACDDKVLQEILDDCERFCLQKRKQFGYYEVVIEGAKYNLV